MALYKDVHPEYASYLYLMAPISLAILNPIGLILMEIAKIAQNKTEHVSVIKAFVWVDWPNNIVNCFYRYKILLCAQNLVPQNKWPNVIAV